MSRLRRLGSIVAMSIFTGFVLAIVLSVLVFAGATEAVITGSMLIGFAIGWLMLAWFSIKYTDQPQKWAYVPAAYMGGFGLLLIVFRPNGNFIAISSWVWPFLQIALTVWMFLEVKRGLKSRTRRWVIYPVLVVLLITALGGIYERIQETIDKHSYPIQGQLVDVGGFRLHIQCKGSGSPTVLLEPGLGETSSIMTAWIAPEVAKQTKVCVYDREGRGWSEESPHPLNGTQTANILHTLLNNAQIPGPYVIAGHSAGGAYVLNFAKNYPKDVVGVVLLDSMSPFQYEKAQGWPAFYNGFRRASALVPTLTRLGLGRLIYSSAYADLPTESRNQERAFWATPQLWRSQRDEFSVIRQSLYQVQDLKNLDNKPLYVITAQKEALGGWIPLQEQLAKLSDNSVHVVLPDAVHQSVVEDEKYSDISSRAIIAVINAVRTGKPLTKQ